MEDCDDPREAFVSIDVSPKFKETHSKLYDLIASETYHADGFSISTQVIALNAANYTAWQYRRFYIGSLNPIPSELLHAEFDFCNKLIHKSPKNYQVWQHRKWLSEKLMLSLTEINDRHEFYKSEFSVLDGFLDEDSKNMNVFGQRVFLVELASNEPFIEDLYDDDVMATRKLILSDVRNNSAFSHRNFLLNRRYKKEIPADIQEDELHFCREIVELTPHNESVWNYLWSFEPAWRENLLILEEIEECLRKDPANVYALESRLKLAESNRELRDRMLDQLADADKIRSAYWLWRKTLSI
jgi:protein farnesyltransferase/geranylgeranyltransferase type-1 subunit alpha